MIIQNKKIILVGIHGRPSIKKMFCTMKNKDVELHIRRRNPKTGKETMRIYRNNCDEIAERVPVANLRYENCTIFRWGNCIVLDTENCKIYNKSEAIAIASAKGKCREVLNKKNIAVPVIVMNGESDSFPVIARPQTHAKGKNLLILNNQKVLSAFYNDHKDWYYAQFFKKEREIRCHVAFGKILCVMEKPAPENKNMVAWNRAQTHLDWSAVKWSEYPKEACLQALKAVEAVGLDTGGVDVMIKGNEAKVLEINTAPTLISTEYTISRYAMFFDWVFNQTNPKHWDFTQFKKPESYAWKNAQLKGEE